jgi:hypothetical protein
LSSKAIPLPASCDAGKNLKGLLSKLSINVFAPSMQITKLFYST